VDATDGDAVILILLIVALAADDAERPLPPTEVKVISVYDGDTFTIETGDKVRLRWVNTPELRPKEAYGGEATEAARALVDGETVTLAYNPEDARDGYGRLIAGASVGDKDLSLHLVELGLGHLFIIPPDNTDLSQLEDAQKKARADKIGIWSTDRYQGVLHITSFHANARGDDRENVNGEYLRVCNVGDTPADLSTFRLRDAQEHEWALPSIQLPVGHTVKIHSGKGENQGDAAQQIAVYLQSDMPVWNNDGDTALLVDADGQVVDSREHKASR
jgi:micrococcal nuclease